MPLLGTLFAILTILSVIAVSPISTTSAQPTDLSCETATGFVGDPKTYVLSLEGTDYIIRYNGYTIQNVTIIKNENSIQIELLSSKQYTVKFDCRIIEVPRAVIDSITDLSNGTVTNSNFTIVADDSPKPISYREPYSDSEERLLVIPLYDETSVLHIMGNRVIPEFGSFASMVTLSGLIGCLVVMGRKTRL